MEETKQCLECGRVLPLSEFNKNSQKKFGVDSVCRECTNAKFHKREWMGHNLAYERYPWPFDTD